VFSPILHFPNSSHSRIKEKSMIYGCKWPNGDLSFVVAPDKITAIITLDEEGGAGEEDLFQIPTNVGNGIAIHLKAADPSVTEGAAFVLEGFSEALSDILRAHEIVTDRDPEENDIQSEAVYQLTVRDTLVDTIDATILFRDPEERPILAFTKEATERAEEIFARYKDEFHSFHVDFVVPLEGAVIAGSWADAIKLIEAKAEELLTCDLDA
jgi:hypothetical protein